MRLTLLRSAAYSAHAWEDINYMPKDRFVPRMDQGERLFRFSLVPGSKPEQLAKADRKGLEFNQRPYALQAFPSGEKNAVRPSLVLSAPSVLVASLRQDGNHSNSWLVRLFNPLDKAVRTEVEWMGQAISTVSLEPLAFGQWRIGAAGIEPVDCAV